MVGVKSSRSLKLGEELEPEKVCELLFRGELGSSGSQLLLRAVSDDVEVFMQYRICCFSGIYCDLNSIKLCGLLCQFQCCN